MVGLTLSDYLVDLSNKAEDFKILSRQGNSDGSQSEILSQQRVRKIFITQVKEFHNYWAVYVCMQNLSRIWLERIFMKDQWL